jgi:hypothetical protein
MALLNNNIISGRSPTSESDSSPSNQGFNKEVGDLSCLFILVISNAVKIKDIVSVVAS